MGAPPFRIPRAWLVATAVVAVAALAACSGGAGTSSTTLTGEPVVIGSAGPDTGQVFSAPEQLEGLKAAVQAVNAAGGIKGRPVQLEFCDTKFSPNGEINCARRLVAKKVVATVDTNFTADASGTARKLLSDAKIPTIGDFGFSPASLTSEYAYLLGGGVPGWYYGTAAALVNAGAKRVAIVVGPTPVSQYAGQIMAQGLDSAKIPNTTVSFDPRSDPTGQTAAAKATAAGVDGIGLAMGTSAIPVLLSAAHRGGYSGAVASCGCIVTPAAIKSLGADSEGLMLVSQTAFTTDTANRGVASYLADLKALDPAYVPTDTGIFSWSAVKLFAAVANGMTTIDAAAVKDALDKLTQPVDIGTVAPWSVAGKTPPSPEWPRVLNPVVQVGVVHDGVVRPDGKGFINPFEELKKSAPTATG